MVIITSSLIHQTNISHRQKPDCSLCIQLQRCTAKTRGSSSPLVCSCSTGGGGGGLSNHIHIFTDFPDRSQKSLICSPHTTINRCSVQVVPLADITQGYNERLGEFGGLYNHQFIMQSVPYHQVPFLAISQNENEFLSVK